MWTTPLTSHGGAARTAFSVTSSGSASSSLSVRIAGAPMANAAIGSASKGSG